MKRIYLFVMLLGIPLSDAFAQQVVQLKGHVASADSKEDLPGVNILVKGTMSGTVTDSQGNFTLENVPVEGVLVISFIGYTTIEQPVGNQTTISIELSPDLTELDEVVVVGYGEQSRATLTSAISSLPGKGLHEIPTNTVSSVLQGKIAGVRVSQLSGQPGTEAEVMIRGGSSINKSNAPLYIIDGFPRPANDINPKDIESVEVLKDASATAIYGARASNGVIVITTRKGKAGMANINFEYSTGFQEFPRQIETITAEQNLQIMRPAAVASTGNAAWVTGQTSTGTGNDETSTWTTRFLADGEAVPDGWHSTIDPVTGNTLVFQDNNLQDILFRRAAQSNYYLSASGGSENINYYAGVGYVDQQGVAIGTAYDRLSFRTNVNFQLSKKIMIGTSTDHALSQTNQFENEANIFTRGAFNSRTIRYEFEDGTPGWGNNANLANPLWVTRTRSNQRANQRSTIGVKGDWEIIPDLHFRPSANYYSAHYTQDYFEYAHNYNTQRPATAIRNQDQSYQYELLLTYDRKIGELHNFSALAGYTNLFLETDNVTAEAFGASTDNIPTLNVAPEKTDASSSLTEEKLIGYFGRLLYNYDYKYLFSASIRRDGSSKFGAANQFGVFPSFSAGWVISKEPFMSGLSGALDFAKLRVSYGQTGNNDIGRYAAQGNYSATYRYGGSAGIRSTAMPNAGLGWEKTTQFDVGLDVHLLQGKRIELTLDYYIKRSDDLLFSLQLPRETGFDVVETNIGSVEFRGFESVLSTRNILKSNFSWRTDFNIAYNTNEVLKLPNRDGVEGNRVNGIIFPDGTGVGGIAEGERLDGIVGYQVDFLIDNDEQASNAAYDELATGYDPVTRVSTPGRKFPGDFEWVDRDGNNRINSLDQFVLGYSIPRTTGGLTNTFNYRNFELVIFADFALGHSIMDMARGWSNGIGARDIAQTTDILKAWKAPGDAANTDHPRVYFHDPSGQRNHVRENSYYTYKADYLCLRDVRLAYNLPAAWISKLGINSLRMYVAGNNLYYFTRYPGYSPERGGMILHNQGQYPTFRTMMFGVNLGL